MVFTGFKKKLEIRLFFLLLLFCIFKQNKSTNSLYINLPYSLFLSNDNIFVIHQNGVSIFDTNFTKIIKNEIIFSESEKTEYEASFSRLTVSQFQNGYIISLINDKIYIFDHKGNLIFQTTEKIKDDNIMPYYYTLVPFKYFGGYYFYLIGFVYNGVVYLNYYKYHLIDKDNILIRTITINDCKDEGLSCQLMSSNFNDKILICFFLKEGTSFAGQIVIYGYSISETDIQKTTEAIINAGIEYIKCIKSVINYSGTKSFVCLYDGINNATYCFIFDSNDVLNKGTIVSLKRFFTNKCNTNFYSLRVGYIQGKEEFIMSTLSISGNLFTRVYNYNWERTLLMDKFINCTYVKGYSILYSYKNNEFYDLSDVQCYGKRHPFNILTNEIEFQVEEIITIPTTLIETTIPKIIIETTILTTLVETTIPTTLIETTIPTTLVESTIPKIIIETTVPIISIKTTIIETDKVTNRN